VSGLSADPEAFAGVTGSGDPVMGLAYAQAQKITELVDAEAPITKRAQAWHHAGVMLATAAQTAISDAARMAILTHLAARPGTTWIRVVRPPCCARCAILAGKKGSSLFYADEHCTDGLGISAKEPTFEKVKTVDTTGAGDTFGACILHDVLQNGFTDFTLQDGAEKNSVVSPLSLIATAFALGLTGLLSLLLRARMMLLFLDLVAVKPCTSNQIERFVI